MRANLHRSQRNVLESLPGRRPVVVRNLTFEDRRHARSFELRAAFSLARLYQSSNRAADAHAALGPALEGFLPTPEFPEIEQAQALLGALAETDEVKNAAASRQRRLKLQTGYGQALMWSRGFGAEESKAAFIRARELAAATDNPTERGTRQRCCALQDRDTIYFTSFQATRAPPVRSVSVGAERSMVAPANECLSKVVFFGDRSSRPMTKSHTERNHQGKSTISLLRQIADTPCEEAARSREWRGEPLRSYQQDAA